MSDPNDRDDKTADNSEVSQVMKQHQTTADDARSGSSQDDDDNDCWDDAKELLHSSGSTWRTELSECETTINHQIDAVDANPTSSSSGYSSIRSNTLKPVAFVAPQKKTTQSAEDLILHEAIFKNDTDKIFEILNNHEFVKQKQLVNLKDKHGNTALHLACMLGRSKEVVSAFLQSGIKWGIDVKNLNRWTPFHEACSYGNREVIVLMAQQLKDDVDDALNNNKLSEYLEKTKNYKIVLKWEFQSWVPFITRVLPSDVCTINKQGKFIRIDTRLLDFEGLLRKKGDSCLIYANKRWVVLNNKTKKYQYFETPNVCRNIEDKVDELMSTDIIDLELKSSEMQLTRSTCGWIWKADKVGKVGPYNVALYNFNNVFLITTKRREHLTEEDLNRNKIAYKTAVHLFKFGEKPELENTSSHGNDSQDDGEQDDIHDEESEKVHRESQPPPPPTNVTWEEYIWSEPGQYPTLGREQKCKSVKKLVKASVAMSEEFPITKKEFLDLLSIIPLKLFKKLKDFVEMKLPEGFPVRLDIPVFTFLTARITFEDFAFIDGPVNESLFTIPSDYEEDPNLLPGRLKRGAGSDTSQGPKESFEIN